MHASKPRRRILNSRTERFLQFDHEPEKSELFWDPILAFQRSDTKSNKNDHRSGADPYNAHVLWSNRGGGRERRKAWGGIVSVESCGVPLLISIGETFLELYVLLNYITTNFSLSIITFTKKLRVFEIIYLVHYQWLLWSTITNRFCFWFVYLIRVQKIRTLSSHLL